MHLHWLTALFSAAVLNWLTLLFSGVAAVTGLLVLWRSVAAARAVEWAVERRDGEHVLVCQAGAAEDVEIDLSRASTALSWGELRHPRLTKGDVVRIATFMPPSRDVHPDVVEVKWRVGRRRYSRTAQIL